MPGVPVSLVGDTKCGPGIGVHIAQQAFLPGELGMGFEMRGGAEVESTGVAG